MERDICTYLCVVGIRRYSACPVCVCVYLCMFLFDMHTCKILASAQHYKFGGKRKQIVAYVFVYIKERGGKDQRTDRKKHFSVNVSACKVFHLHLMDVYD